MSDFKLVTQFVGLLFTFGLIMVGFYVGFTNLSKFVDDPIYTLLLIIFLIQVLNTRNEWSE